MPNTRHPGWPTDPPTDPHGHRPAEPAGLVLPPHPAAAASLAAAFATDYLSWDEAEPARRGQALARYLGPDTEADPARLGWSGHGRQRADFALPGLTRPDGDRIMVDVRVRVTPYQRVGRPEPAPPEPPDQPAGDQPDPAPTPAGQRDPGQSPADQRSTGSPPADQPASRPPAQPGVVGMAAAAPAPEAPGWRGLAAHWVRLAVPITLDGDRLVVDALDEQ